MDKYRGVFEGTCEELEVMDDEIFRCEDMLDRVMMPEIDGVGEEKHFSGVIDDVEAA